MTTPFRYTPAPDRAADFRRRYEGAVKVRLLHSRGRSFLLPDLVFLRTRGGWVYFRPLFFTAHEMAFENGKIVKCFFAVDVSGPRDGDAIRLRVELNPAALRQHYDGGAQLYECTLHGPPGLEVRASGPARRTPTGDFAVELNHYTTPAAKAGILKDRHLKSSNWTLQGTRTFSNIAHAYFTTLPHVKTEEDLRRIAMASDGELQFITTRTDSKDELVSFTVYRGRTLDRTDRVRLWVPSGAIAPPNLLRHSPRQGAVYYEIVSPEILRAATAVGGGLPFDDHGEVTRGFASIRTNYVIVGDAATPKGLAAPFIEEERSAIAHIEELPIGDDPFCFWLRNANTNQLIGRHPTFFEFDTP